MEEEVAPLLRCRPVQAGAVVVKTLGRAVGVGGRKRPVEEEGGAWSLAEGAVGNRQRVGEGGGSPGGPREGPRRAEVEVGEVGWGPRRRREEGRGVGTMAGGV